LENYGEPVANNVFPDDVISDISDRFSICCTRMMEESPIIPQAVLQAVLLAVLCLISVVPGDSEHHRHQQIRRKNEPAAGPMSCTDDGTSYGAILR
jgi:hypothetical protein